MPTTIDLDAMTSPIEAIKAVARREISAMGRRDPDRRHMTQVNTIAPTVIMGEEDIDAMDTAEESERLSLHESRTRVRSATSHRCGGRAAGLLAVACWSTAILSLAIVMLKGGTSAVPVQAAEATEQSSRGDAPALTTGTALISPMVDHAPGSSTGGNARVDKDSKDAVILHVQSLSPHPLRPPPPPPPPSPAPTPPLPASPCTSTACVLNDRFRLGRARPGADLGDLGVLVHQIDQSEMPHTPWLPCPSTGMWCSKLADRISGTIINAQLTLVMHGQTPVLPLFSKLNAGYVIRPGNHTTKVQAVTCRATAWRSCALDRVAFR